MVLQDLFEHAPPRLRTDPIHLEGHTESFNVSTSAVPTSPEVRVVDLQPLEAQVAISGPAEILVFLRSFGDDLRFLFLTSGVTFGAPAETVSVTVLPAEGTKCQRCWNYTDDVGSDPEWPGACARCAQSVRLILAESPR